MPKQRDLTRPMQAHEGAPTFKAMPAPAHPPAQREFMAMLSACTMMVQLIVAKRGVSLPHLLKRCFEKVGLQLRRSSSSSLWHQNPADKMLAGHVSTRTWRRSARTKVPRTEYLRKKRGSSLLVHVRYLG